MTEVARPNWDDNFIWTGAVWDASFRAMLAELALAFAWSSKHETDSGGGVLGGFAWSNPSGLTTRIGRGLALMYDAAIASPGPKWKWCINRDNADGTHTSRHATLDRVDAVSMSFALVEGVAQTLGRKGASPASTNTQARSVGTLVITAGTPHASAWANKASMPAGNLPLFYVVVPSTADGGALSVVDARTFIAGGKNRAPGEPMTTQTEVGTDANMLEVSARKAQPSDSAFLSSLRWDVAKDWPYIIRGKGGSGEVGTALYPMLIKGDRSWWRSVNFVAASALDSDAAQLQAYGSDANGYMSVNRASAGAAISRCWLTVPADARGLQVIGAKFRYRTTEAFDATVGSAGRAMKLVHVAADGTVTELLSHNLTIASTHGSVQTVTYVAGSGDDGDLAATPVLAEGDTLYWVFMLELTASGTANAGDLRLYSASVQFKEARE